MRVVKRNTGMSLIECLVALLVLTIGLMGMASLMLQGLRSGYLALIRTQAVNLVSDMGERIRANPGAAGAYDCATYTGGPSEQGCAPTDSASGTNCSSAQLAQDDLARWQGARARHAAAGEQRSLRGERRVHRARRQR